MTTRRPVDDEHRFQRCGACASRATAAEGGAGVGGGPAGPRRPPAPWRAPAGGPDIVERLRQMAVHAETAAVLERRAARVDTPVLAALLRERAAAHRRKAARLRTALAGQVTPARLLRMAVRDWM